MKLLLVTVSIIAVFTADSQDFRNEPGEAQLLPDGQNLPGGPKMIVSPTQLGAKQTLPERSNSTLEDHQMKESNLLVVNGYLDQDLINVNHQIDDMAMVLGRSRWCRSRGGRCRHHLKFPCADGYQESPEGRPYCTSDKRRCCYPVCRSGEVYVGAQCLTFSDERMSWQEAKQACVSRKGQLASLNDPDAILDYVNKEYASVEFWAGGTDAVTEGKWLWMTGDRLSDKFPWSGPKFGYGNQPDNRGGAQNCLVVNWGGSYDDQTCDRNPHRYICEYVSRPVIVTTTTAATTKLPGSTLSPTLNWFTVGVDRFVIHNETMSWTNAQTVCESDGLNLYEPRDILAVSKHLEINNPNVNSRGMFWLPGQGNGTHLVWSSGSVVPASAPWYPSWLGVATDECMLLYTSGINADRGTVLGTYRCSYPYNQQPLCG